MNEIDVYRACRDYVVAQDQVISTRVGWCIAVNSVAITAIAAYLVSERSEAVPIIVTLGGLTVLILMNLMFYGNIRFNANTSSSVARGYIDYKARLMERRARPAEERMTGQSQTERCYELGDLPAVEFGYRDKAPAGISAELCRLRNVLLVFALFWFGVAGYVCWDSGLTPFG